MLQSDFMRKNIGWPETFDGVPHEIRVLFDGGERILWRRKAGRHDEWHPFEPTADQWRTLAEKVHARYVRRQAPYKDLQRVERLAAEAARDAARVATAAAAAAPPTPPAP